MNELMKEIVAHPTLGIHGARITEVHQSARMLKSMQKNNKREKI